MSLPGLIAQPVMQAGMPPLGPIEAALAMFSANPYFIGLMMLILNLGGRFLALEITKEQEQKFCKRLEQIGDFKPRDVGISPYLTLDTTSNLEQVFL